MGIDVYVLWVIGWLFTLGILFMANDENEPWYKTLLNALFLIILWPFILGMFYANRKV